MKLQITMKDPDTLLAINERQAELAVKLADELKIGRDAATVEAKTRMESMRELASKYFQYSEYVTVELDDDLQTATVLPKE